MISERTPPLRLAIFDFDQTISVTHVFKQLAGWVSAEEETESVEGDHHEKFSWSIASLGGAARVETLRSFFRTLSEDKHVTLAIITRGNIGCVQLVLHNCGLLKYFTGGVFGNIGDRYGATEFDLSFANDVSLSSLEGDEDHASWSRKTDVIRRLMGDKYEPNEAVFVEDDIKELRAAAKLCRGVYVREQLATANLLKRVYSC
ncbi:hypothetical protein FOZ60_013847, partial [Perkinsus olseni]